MRSTLAVLTSDIFNIGSRPDVAVARSADIDGSREVVRYAKHRPLCSGAWDNIALIEHFIVWRLRH
jgi:hypothetical protein